MRVNFHLNIYNDGKHFSEEEDGMLLFYICALLIFGTVLGTNIYKYIRSLMKEEDRPESPMLILMMAITLHFGHIVF